MRLKLGSGGAALLLCFSVAAFAQSPGARRDPTLSEGEIGRLVTEHPGNREGERLVFRATFTQRHLSPAERNRYSRTGRIPYRITANFDLSRRDRNNRTLTQTQPGRIQMYILDEAGQVVDRRTEASEKMCPG